MTKEEYLSQVGVLSRRITYHTERLLRLRREADAVSSRWGASVSAHSADAPFIRMLENIETAREELEAETELMSRLQEQVGETIRGLPDDRMRMVLLYRFLEGRTYQEIGGFLYVDKATAKRWQQRALQSLRLPEHPVSIYA